MDRTAPFVRRALGVCRRILAAALFAGAALPAMAQADVIAINNQLANKYAYDPLPLTCSRYEIADIPTGFRTEREHAIYNDRTREWVLWAHYEGKGYGLGEALVAHGTSECGPYTIVKTFRPLDREVRDDYVWKDTDGTAYFIAASRKYGGANDTMAIFRLTEDYLDVDESAGTTWAFDNQYREAPIVLKKGAVYFLLTSAAAGWFPSLGAYATATSMLGPWSPLYQLGEASTYGGQNAYSQVIQGSDATANIMVLDHLGGATVRQDGRLWLPVILDDRARTARMDWYSSFSVDTDTGVLTLPSNASIAAGRPATASATAPGSSPQSAVDNNYQTRWSAVSSKSWPAWWRVDLGVSKHIGEIDISWPIVKGSEGIYKYKIEVSNDGTNWTTFDHTDNSFYGFTVDKFDLFARYVRVDLVKAAIWNSPNNNWYTPALWEVRILP